MLYNTELSSPDILVAASLPWIIIHLAAAVFIRHQRAAVHGYTTGNDRERETASGTIRYKNRESLKRSKTSLQAEAVELKDRHLSLPCHWRSFLSVQP